METLFFTGYAKLPGGIVASQTSAMVGISVELDRQGIIVRGDCTLATQLGRDFFGRLVMGYRLREDIDRLSSKVAAHYHGNAQKALIAALRTARERYLAYLESSPGQPGAE